MDDGEVEFSDHVLFQQPANDSSNFQGSSSIDSYHDELLKTSRTCTHTHTCNPPGPDTTHTHTCFHTHTHVIVPEETNLPKPRKPSGNREAVRKYREKKKAQTAYLEEEVKKLRIVNQQLVKRLQGQAVLESEVYRLRGLLLDLKGSIDIELGDLHLPYNKQCNTCFKDGDCEMGNISEANGLQCDVDMSCFNTHLGTSLISLLDGNCMPSIRDCPDNGNGGPTEQG